MAIAGPVNPKLGITKKPMIGNARIPLAEEMVNTLPVVIPALSTFDDK